MYLGIDIGTSSVKAVLIDETSAIVASRSEPLTVERPHPGWSEQDPESWIAATSKALDALAKAHPAEMKRVRGIGLSGQMHGATLLDRADRPLRPCILWNDGRSAEEAAELDADPRFRAITGNIVFPGFTAPKLVWVHRNEPKIFGDVAKVLLPKDYVRLWLSGQHASDMSDSAGTSWLDVAKRDWSDELLAATQPAPRPDAVALRGHRADRQAPLGAGRPLGHAEPAGDRRRRRRQCRLGLRRRHGRARLRLRLDRHVGRPLRRQRAFSAERGERGARLLPRAAEHLAPDGRDPLRRRLARVAGRRDRRHRGRADRFGRRPARRARERALPPLPLRRAHAAQRRRGARQLRRARPRDGPRGARPRRDGGRGVRLRRLPGGAEGGRHEASSAPPRSAAARARAPGCRSSRTC